MTDYKVWGFLSWITVYLLYSHSGSATANTYETLDGLHMFPFGSGFGDELFGVSELPVTVNSNRKITFNKGKFKQIKIYPDGRVELLNKNVNFRFTPNLTPYQPWYSEVAAGRVWFRETNETSLLDEVREEIQTKLPSVGAHFKPKSVKVITWQLQDINPRYPECEPEKRRSHPEFCNCLDSGVYTNLACECFYLINTTFSVYDACICLNRYPDYRYCDCWRVGRIAFDTPNFCYCDAVRKSQQAGICAATTYNIFFQNFSPFFIDLPNACELCECERDLALDHNVCLCRTHANVKDLGMLRCFLLQALDNLQCKVTEPCCSNIMPCQSANDCLSGINTEEECACVLPDTLTEPELMNCLLKNNHLDYIWLCDDPDTVDDLQYCTCIAARNRSDVNDEIFCRCLVLSSATGSDLCDCLSQWGYSGSEMTCYKRKRDTWHALGKHMIPKKLQTREVDDPDYQNVFQLVIAHNNRDTFVYFNYRKLKFINVHIKSNLGSVDDATQSFTGFRHPYTNVFLLRFLMWDSNVGMAGRWIYKADRDIWGPPWNPETYSGPNLPHSFG